MVICVSLQISMTYPEAIFITRKPLKIKATAPVGFRNRKESEPCIMHNNDYDETWVVQNGI
jgi:hypothetical protein